jgi:hypothetical protein
MQSEQTAPDLSNVVLSANLGMFAHTTEERDFKELVNCLHARLGSLSSQKLTDIKAISPCAYSAIHQALELCYTLKARRIL